MSRVRAAFTVVVPSMIAGALVFGGAFSHAAGGHDDVTGFWPEASDVGGGSTDKVRRAPARRTAQRPPTPPTPPAPPTPPLPPKQGPHGSGFGHRGGFGGGVVVKIDGNKVDIGGIDGLVRGQLDGVREMVRNNPHIPRDVREKVLARLDKVKATLDKRLRNMKGIDLDNLDEELERMGEEIEEAMEGLEEDLEKLGDKLGKDWAKKASKLGKQWGHFGPGTFKFDFDADPDIDVDDLDTIPMTPDLDADDHGMAEAISDLKDLALKPGQRDHISKLRADSDRSVAAAKRQLDELANRLETALADHNTSDADISRYVDQISAQEAAIRKARILAWVNARRVLEDAQRKKIEDAAKKRPR